jgi:hypothetical protein
MPEVGVKQKRRSSKPGTKRVVVTMAESEYTELVKLADREMREPNNMLSFMLKTRMGSMLSDYAE